MKKITFLAFMALAIVLSMPACNVTISGIGKTVRGSGNVVEESRAVDNVSSVQLAMDGTLHITVGDAGPLRIEAEDSLLEYIETGVSGGKLAIETRPGINLRPSRPMNYFLAVEEMDAITVTSSGDVVVGDLRSDSLSVRISSSGNVSIDSLDGTTLQVDISSSGNLEIMGGQVQDQDINISSSGEYHAEDLASREVDVTLTSSGTATLRVSDRLDGRLSSSGDVYYIGNPEVDVRTTSSGRAVQMDG